MKNWIITICLAAMILICLQVSDALPLKRTALVVGNSDYQNSPLKNPVNDANDVSKALSLCRFTVTTVINADRSTLRKAIREFGNELKKGGVGLFYYAGHGIQVNGINYLVPVGSEVFSQDEVEDECLEISSVLRKMKSAGNELNIIILDACRDNPFGRSFRSGSRGLAKMDAPTGSIIAYSTAPGSVSADGSGRNGLYTSKLLRHILEPGVKIEELFKRVRIEVIDETRTMPVKQIPWESSSLTGDFYFNRPDPAAEAAPATSTDLINPPELVLPEKSALSLDDILTISKKRQVQKSQWDEWQQKRNNEYLAIREIDRDTYLTGKLKKDAWQKFSAVVAQDNPFSEIDDEMRKHAASRLLYWETIMKLGENGHTGPDRKNDRNEPVTSQNDKSITRSVLEITCDQRDARVYIDKEEKKNIFGFKHEEWIHQGYTPFTTDFLSPGRHLVRITKPGYKDHIQTIDIIPEKTLSLDIKLTAHIAGTSTGNDSGGDSGGGGGGGNSPF